MTTNTTVADRGDNQHATVTPITVTVVTVVTAVTAVTVVTVVTAVPFCRALLPCPSAVSDLGIDNHPRRRRRDGRDESGEGPRPAERALALLEAADLPKLGQQRNRREAIEADVRLEQYVTARNGT